MTERLSIFNLALQGRFSSVQSLSHVQLFVTPWIARPPCPSPTPGVYPNSCPLSRWCHPAISSSVISFSSCPQSLPVSESFPMSQLFTWGGQSTGVSALASFLLKKSQGWSVTWVQTNFYGLNQVLQNAYFEMYLETVFGDVAFKKFQFSSVAQSCLTLCDPMDWSTPGFPVHHQLPKFAQTHVHWVGDAIQPSHPLLSPSPLTFNHSQNQGLFQWVSSLHQVAKVLEFQL